MDKEDRTALGILILIFLIPLLVLLAAQLIVTTTERADIVAEDVCQSLGYQKAYSKGSLYFCITYSEEPRIFFIGRKAGLADGYVK